MNKILKALLALNIAFVGSIFATPKAVITYIKNDTNQPLVIYGPGFKENIPAHQTTQPNIEIPLAEYLVRRAKAYHSAGEIVITQMGMPGGLNLKFTCLPAAASTIAKVILTKNNVVLSSFTEEFNVEGDNASFAIQLHLIEDENGDLVPAAEELDVTPIIH